MLSLVHLTLFFQPRPDTSGVIVEGSADAPVSIGSLVINRLPVPCSANVTVEARNATGPMGEGSGGFESWTTCGSVAGALDPWETLPLLCTVDPKVASAGWFTMRSTFFGASCWTANDTGPQVIGVLL